MFKDLEKKEKYLQKNKIIYDRDTLNNEDCFKWDENGKMILETSKCAKSMIDVMEYATCIGWIMLQDGKMALIKNNFGDVYRQLDLNDYYTAKYNTIMLPEIARQFQNEAAQYYIATREKNKNESTNLDFILTTDFKDKEQDEELIEGIKIVSEQLNISKILNFIEQYLEERNASLEDIENVRKDFIKQTIFNKFIEQSDENNRNWGIIRNKDNRYKMSPIYDLDCACNIGKQRKKQRMCNNESTNLESIIMQYKNEPWMKEYIKYIIRKFDLQKAFTNAKLNTNIDIERIDEIEKTKKAIRLKERYENFFEGRIEEVKRIYNKCYNIEKTDDCREDAR